MNELGLVEMVHLVIQELKYYLRSWKERVRVILAFSEEFRELLCIFFVLALILSLVTFARCDSDAISVSN